MWAQSQGNSGVQEINDVSLDVKREDALAAAQQKPDQQQEKVCKAAMRSKQPNEPVHERKRHLNTPESDE